MGGLSGAIVPENGKLFPSRWERITSPAFKHPSVILRILGKGRVMLEFSSNRISLVTSKGKRLTEMATLVEPRFLTVWMESGCAIEDDLPQTAFAVLHLFLPTKDDWGKLCEE